MDNHSFFAQSLIRWFKANARDLPWRHTTDPYAIWVSEVILQQTRVKQGLPYYHKFLETFPTVAHLAAAEQSEVLRVWQGLGYYSRARNMHYTAKQALAEFGGVFPESYSELLKLKGIGPYTAAAVAAFAHNETVAALDGNAFRVLSRFFNISEPFDKPSGQKVFKALADLLVPVGQGRDYNQAVMELGATICTPKQYQCNVCPIAELCSARKNNSQGSLPVKSGKVEVKNLYLYYLVQNTNNGIWLAERKKGGIWKGLYDLPVIESEIKLEGKVKPPFLNSEFLIQKPIFSFLHKLTHRNLFIEVHKLDESQLNYDYLRLHQYSFNNKQEAEALPKPLPVSKILDTLFQSW